MAIFIFKKYLSFKEFDFEGKLFKGFRDFSLNIYCYFKEIGKKKIKAIEYQSVRPSLKGLADCFELNIIYYRS